MMSTMRISTRSTDALVVAGEQAEHDPADERDRDRDRADLERDLRAVDDARERVAADLVGAHRMRPARALESEADGSFGSTVQM